MDNLKLGLVALIIAVHAVAAYSSLEGAWPYQRVREVRLTAVGDAVLIVPLAPGLLFVMGLFFLLSGLATPGSLVRKGPPRFLRDRILRLGLPLAVWVLGVWPALLYAIHAAAGERGSYWHWLLHAKPFLDPGPMWFVELLLLYSIVYGAFQWWHQRAPIASPAGPGRARGRLGVRTLVLLAVGTSMATMFVRPVFPFMSTQIAQLKLWQWPEYLALFGLGIAASQRGWLDPVPDRIQRACGITALIAMLVFLALTGAIVAAGLDLKVVGDAGVHWPSLALAAVEGPLAISAAIWLLGAAQRHLDGPPRPSAQVLARSSYAAFILQGVVLTGLMLVLRPIGVPAEVKALVVAVLGLTGSFALASLLVTRTPVGRIL